MPYQRFRTVCNVPAPARVGYALAGDIAWTHAVQITRPDGTPIDAWGATISFPDGYQGPIVWTNDYDDGAGAQYVVEEINPGADEYTDQQASANGSAVAAIRAKADLMTFGPSGIAAQVGGYNTSMSPSEQVLTYPTQKILTDTFGYVSATGGSGAGGTDWIDAERQQVRYILGIDGTKATPTGAPPRLSDIYGFVNKLLYDMAGNVLSAVNAYAAQKSPAEQVLSVPTQRIVADATGGVRVGTYATGLSPAEQILSIPANKLATDASGYVTSSNTGGGGTGVGDWTANELNQIRYVLGIDGTKTVPAGTSPRISDIYTTLSTNIGPIRAKTDQLAFSAGMVVSQVNAYLSGQDPRAQLLANAANRLNVDGSGNVVASAVTIAASGLNSVMVDSLSFIDVMRGVASMAMGEVDFDPGTLTGTVSRPNDPNAVKIRFSTDEKLQTRKNINLTLNA